MRAPLLVSILLLIPMTALAQDDAPAAESATMSMTAAADVAYMPLDPEQPDGIQMALISGDPSAGPFRAIVRFPTGFASGLHTHDDDYMAVSLSGQRTRGPSDDALTELPAGSYWTQPGGEPHVDHCVGDAPCVIYLDMHGAMSMTPVEAPGTGEPGMAMMPAGDVPWGPMMPDMPDGPQLAIISGDMATGPVAVLMRFPSGNDSGLHTHTATYTAVVLEGTAQHGADADSLVDLGPGSYWIQPGGEAHLDRCVGETSCTILVQLDGPFDMAPVAAAE